MATLAELRAQLAGLEQALADLPVKLPRALPPEQLKIREEQRLQIRLMIADIQKQIDEHPLAELSAERDELNTISWSEKTPEQKARAIEIRDILDVAPAVSPEPVAPAVSPEPAPTADPVVTAPPPEVVTDPGTARAMGIAPGMPPVEPQDWDGSGIVWLGNRTAESDALVEEELRIQVASILGIKENQVQPQQLDEYANVLRSSFVAAGNFFANDKVGMFADHFLNIMTYHSMSEDEIDNLSEKEGTEREKVLGSFSAFYRDRIAPQTAAWKNQNLIADPDLNKFPTPDEARAYILKELKKAGVPIQSVDSADLEDLMAYQVRVFMSAMEYDPDRIDTTPQEDHFYLQNEARTFAADIFRSGLTPAIIEMRDEIAAAQPEEDIRTAAIKEFIDELPYKQSKKDWMKSPEGLASFDREYWAGGWDSIEQFLLAEGEGSATEFAAELLETAERGTVSQADFEAVRNFIDDLTTVDVLGVAPITDGQKTLLSSQANIEKFLQEYYISGQSMENFLASSGQKMATDIVETARGVAAGEDTREGRQDIFLERIGMSTKRGGLGIDITNPDARNIANQIFAKAEEEYLKEQLEGGKRTLKQIQDEFIGQMPTEAEIERRIELQYGTAPPGLTEDEASERQKVMDAKMAALADKAERGEEVTADEIMAASDPIQGIADIALERLSERIGTAEEVLLPEGYEFSSGEKVTLPGGQRAWATPSWQHHVNVRGTLAQQNALAQDIEMQRFLMDNPEAAKAFASGDRDKLKNFLVGSTHPISGAFIPGYFDPKIAFGISDEEYEIQQGQGALAPPPPTEEEDKNLALYNSMLDAQKRQFPDKPIYDVSQTPGAGKYAHLSGGYFAAENLRKRQSALAQQRQLIANQQADREKPRTIGGRTGF